MNKGKNQALILIGIALMFLGFYSIFCHFNSPRYNNIHAIYITEKIRPTVEKSIADNLIENTQSGKININTATKDELMQLSSIGEKKAQAIIDYRKINGKFREIYELTYVDGITDKIIAENLGKITV